MFPQGEPTTNRSITGHQNFNLRGEFLVDATERALISTVAQSALYWEQVDTLPAGTFAVERACWATVASAAEAEDH